MKSGGGIWDQTHITICIACEEGVDSRSLLRPTGVRGVDRGGRVSCRSTSDGRGSVETINGGRDPPRPGDRSGVNGQGVLRDEGISGSEKRRKRGVNWGCNRSQWLTLRGQSPERNESELIYTVGRLCSAGEFLSQGDGRYERTRERGCGSRDGDGRT